MTIFWTWVLPLKAQVLASHGLYIHPGSRWTGTPSPVVQRCSEGHRKGWNFWNAESTGVPCPLMIHLPGLSHSHRVHLALALLWLPTQPRASQGQAAEGSPCLGPLTGQTALHLPEQADGEHPEKAPRERLLRG